MPIVTLGCNYGKHETCKSKICECECHQTLEEAQARRKAARDLVTRVLTVFHDNPDLYNTHSAILALQQYEQLLKEARRGR